MPTTRWLDFYDGGRLAAFAGNTGSYSSAVNWLQQAVGELAPDRRNSERWCCSIWLLPTRRRTLSTPRR
jgi:hypothetical protein